MAKKPKRPSDKPAPSMLELAPIITVPLNLLVLSDENVRQDEKDDEIPQLAETIAKRNLLQSLSVRAVLDDEGKETGKYAVQGGGRRLRALQFLAKHNRLAKDAPIPCIVKTTGNAVEDSLSENVDRKQLHPISQFRAFAAMKSNGDGDEVIAAAFSVTPALVRQRLRLAAAHPDLLEAYRDDEMTLDALMAFCVTDDQQRQLEVWEQIKDQSSSAYQIKRMLTESSVKANDRRAVFVGADAYEAAGGFIMRDLFDEDNGGWFTEPTLLLRLVNEKLDGIVADLKAQGWKWVEAAVDIPHDLKMGLIRLKPLSDELSEEDQAKLDALNVQLEKFPDWNDLNEKDQARVEAIEAEITRLENLPSTFSADDMARGGVLVDLSYEGTVDFDYGFVRREDDVQPEEGEAISGEGDTGSPAGSAEHEENEEPEETGKPLPERLIQDLTSFRTVALRNELAKAPDVAYVAILHAMCLGQFYTFPGSTSLQVTTNRHFPANAPGLSEWAPTKAIEQRHAEWQARLPKNPNELWEVLLGMNTYDAANLLAHCVSLTINAVRDPHQRKEGVIRHSNELARDLGLDMNAVGWVNTADSYFSRVTKAHILEAVREGKGEQAVHLIEDLKKDTMAKEAQRLLEGTGWLPEVLRAPCAGAAGEPSVTQSVERGELPAFLNEEETHAA